MPADIKKTGRQIHADVEHAREAGDFWGSIKLALDAIKTYQEEKDYLGLSEVHGSIALAYRHLYRQSQDKNFLVLAIGSATTGIEIAEINNLNEAAVLPTFNLAKAQEEVGNLSEAALTYQDALEKFQKNPPKLHNRPAVLADIKIHAFTCQYKAGDKTALPKALSAIDELKQSGEEKTSKYNFDVWLSGAHIRIAEILKDEDKELAKKHLDLASQIVAANPDLKLRKEQLNKISQSVNA